MTGKSKKVDILEEIRTALTMLDHDNDDHWTEKGRPKNSVVDGLVGQDVTNEQIMEAAPDFDRQLPPEANVTADGVADSDVGSQMSSVAEDEELVEEESEGTPPIPFTVFTKTREVKACQIKGYEQMMGGAKLFFSNGSSGPSVIVDKQFLKEFKPAIGDYYLEYEVEGLDEDGDIEMVPASECVDAGYLDSWTPTAQMDNGEVEGEQEAA